MSLGILHEKSNTKTIFSLVDYEEYGGRETITLLTEAQAAAIAGRKNRIHPGFGTGISASENPADLEILRIAPEKPNSEVWKLRIAGEDVTTLSDRQVEILIEMSTPVFEPGQPDWQTRDAEKIDDEIHALEQNIHHIRQSITKLKRDRIGLEQHISMRDDLPERADTPVGELMALSRYLSGMNMSAGMTFYPNGASKFEMGPQKLPPEHLERLQSRIMDFMPVLLEAETGSRSPAEGNVLKISMDGKSGPWIIQGHDHLEINLARLEEISFEEEVDSPSP